MVHVLDTDACVDLLREPDDTLPLVRPLEDQGPLLVTAPTVQELHEGAHRAGDASRETRRVTRFLSSLQVLPHDEATAEAAGTLAATLLDRGTPIGDVDTAIAGIARHHGGTLVTRNVDHFRRVPDLPIHAL